MDEDGIVRINDKLSHKIRARHGLTMDVPICYNIDCKAKKGNRRMNGKEGRDTEVKVGCGCGGCLLEIIAFVLICSLFGCEWARNALSDWTRWIGSTVQSACEAPADKQEGGAAR